jgi:anti-anti-sigma factor
MIKMLQVDFSSKAGYTVAHIIGRLDTVTATDFEGQMSKLISEGVTRIIFDCTKLGYVSSSGLRVFLLVQKQISALGGKLKVCCLQPSIREIFDISGFSQIFSLFDSVESASQH